MSSLFESTAPRLLFGAMLLRLEGVIIPFTDIVGLDGVEGQCSSEVVALMVGSGRSHVEDEG